MDASLFPAFEDSKLWDSWCRSTIANANAQDAAEVLDSTYVSASTEDRDLFKEK